VAETFPGFPIRYCLWRLIAAFNDCIAIRNNGMVKLSGNWFPVKPNLTDFITASMVKSYIKHCWQCI
jgi:hypothetical protein